MQSRARISVQDVQDLGQVRAAWRGLQARADASVFQTEAWVFCLAEQRARNMVVLRAERAGELVGLALVNRRGGALHLAETGDPALDAVFIEHNGPLLARGHEDLLGAFLAALLHASGRGGVRLSGVAPELVAALPPGTVTRVLGDRLAPFIALNTLDPGPDGFLAGLSANTRQQLRRSNRSYAQAGPVAVRRAASVEEALAFLDALAVLHQARWTARGKPGAFANPDFVAFHRTLVAEAVPQEAIDLLRITAGTRVIGYLYNLRHERRVFAYQAGFDYDGATSQEKPGLTCHHAAIERAREEGMLVYDFLAGADRYKSSLANRTGRMLWLQAARRASLAGAVIMARERLSRG